MDQTETTFLHSYDHEGYEYVVHQISGDYSKRPREGANTLLYFGHGVKVFTGIWPRIANFAALYCHHEHLIFQLGTSRIDLSNPRTIVIRKGLLPFIKSFLISCEGKVVVTINYWACDAREDGFVEKDFFQYVHRVASDEITREKFVAFWSSGQRGQSARMSGPSVE